MNIFRRKLVKRTSNLGVPSSFLGHAQFFDSSSVLFLPGAFLILTGIAALLMPHLFVALVSAFFLALGVLFCVAAWKLVQFKMRLSKIAKNIEAQIQVQTSKPTMFYDIGDGSEDPNKKIILH